jgi:hypothetical protein
MRKNRGAARAGAGRARDEVYHCQRDGDEGGHHQSLCARGRGGREGRHYEVLSLAIPVHAFSTPRHSHSIVLSQHNTLSSPTKCTAPPEIPTQQPSKISAFDFVEKFRQSPRVHISLTIAYDHLLKTYWWPRGHILGMPLTARIYRQHERCPAKRRGSVGTPSRSRPKGRVVRCAPCVAIAAAAIRTQGENWAMALLPIRGVTIVSGQSHHVDASPLEIRISNVHPTLLGAYLHADPGDDGGDVRDNTDLLAASP